MIDSTHRYISACFRLMAIVLVVKARKTLIKLQYYFIETFNGQETPVTFLLALD